MNKKINFAVLTLASALFTGVLVNGSPLNVNADDDFIVDLHYETFLKVEAGHNFTVVLSTNNEVFTFGRNDRGQLGNGTTEASLAVFNITDSFNLNTGETIVDIAAGWGFTVASTSSNRIFAWGDAQVVQLAKGLVSDVPQTTPFDLTSSFNPNNSLVRKIAAGDSNIMVWTDTNVVRMAGGNNFGQLSQANINVTTGAVSVNWNNFLINEVLVDVGIFAQTAYALTESGRVLTWGNNNAKQLGVSVNINFGTLPQNITASFGLTAPEKVVSVSIGVNHGIAITNAYKIFFWGTNFNSAAGDTTTLPKGTVKNVPFNATAAFIYPEDNGWNDGFANNFDRDFSNPNIIYYEEVYRPLKVYAGNDATLFDVEIAYRYYNNNVPQAYEYNYYVWAIGLNVYEGQKYILTGSSRTEFIETRYVDFNTYNEGYDLIDFGFSRTHSIYLNSDNDFTIFGSNLFGEHGIGYTTLGGSYYNSNYSYYLREFENYPFGYLPTNLTAPLEDYFYPNGVSTPALRDEENAIFGYFRGVNENIRVPGIVDYLFPESYTFGYSLTEKEWSALTAEQKTFMNQIIATVYEDEILYESYIRTDELIYEELEYGREAADWLRYDMNYYSNYGSYELGWDEELFLYDDIIALLPASVEARLDYYRELLAAVEGFEDTYLQPFLALMEAETNDANVDIDFVYFDEYYDGNALDLDYEQIEYLIDNDYESMILDIFTAYDALPELVQLLINEWNFYGIYEELYYTYHYYYTDAYSDELYDFMDDIQDGEWDWYWPLFENLTDLEALLEKINQLPEVSREWFTETFEDQFGEVYYDYNSYGYWIWLNDLLPYLQEGKDVYEDILAIEEMDLDNLSEETIEAISNMYEAYLALSEEAQELLDPDYVSWLVSLVLETVEGSIEELPGSVEDFDLLFNDAETKDATVNSLLGAWNQYQAMSDELKDEMDQEARAHLEALYARYLELTRPSVDLFMIGLILVHLSAGVYFAFKKRDVLVKPVQ
jgi:hypothetical protein